MSLHNGSHDMADDADGSADSLESSLTEMDWLGRLNMEGCGLRGLIGGGLRLATDDETEGRGIQSAMTTPGRVSSKPPFSYTNLITAAISSTPTKMMALNDIYQWISDRFPYYRHAAPGWKVDRPGFYLENAGSRFV